MVFKIPDLYDWSCQVLFGHSGWHLDLEFQLIHFGYLACLDKDNRVQDVGNHSKFDLPYEPLYGIKGCIGMYHSDHSNPCEPQIGEYPKVVESSNLVKYCVVWPYK